MHSEIGKGATASVRQDDVQIFELISVETSISLHKGCRGVYHRSLWESLGQRRPGNNQHNLIWMALNQGL